MMERRRARKQPSGRLGATDVVAVCKAYSQRLKEKPVRVKLHVSTGRVADGTITLDTDPLKGGPAKIVVQAQGSNLFGLVKRKFQHVFRVGELERSRSTHTVFLLRSIKQLAKGNDAMKEEILARSLSLVHKDEAVDMTFANREECDKLGEWIDAKWSVSMIQKSFRGNSRIALALQGKERGGSDGGRAALEDDDEGHREREGVGMVDGAGFGRLPTLDRAAKMKLQDDLLDGVHVAYHDLSLRGYRSNSSPRRLRYDCESKAGLIYLEPSFEGDGPTIIQPISTLIQVGGGPSAFGLTASLLRATADKKEQRAKAVSLVFSERSVDITCGSEEDATELVLYFSEVKGFTRAKPPSQDLDLTPLPMRAAPAPAPAPVAAAAQSAAGAGEREALPDSVSKETWRDLGAISGGAGVGGHRGEHSPARQVAGRAGAAAGAAVHSADPTREKGMDPSFSTRFRSGYRVGDGDEDAELERQASAASGFSAASSLLGAGTHAHRHGNKSSAAPATETDEAALLEKQASAASGFGASPSLRMITSPASPSGGDGGRGGGNGNGRSSITQHRMWTTHQGTTSAAQEASDAARFRSAPGATRRSTIAGAPDPPKRGMRPAGGSAWERGDKVHSSGQHHDHSRHHGDSKAARGASPTPAAAAAVAAEGPHRIGCTVGQLPGSRETNEPVQRGRHFSNPGGGDFREPLTSPTAKAREAAARRRHDTGGGGGTTSWVAIPSPTRGSGGTAPPPPLPPREVGGAGGGVEVADHRAAERQRPRSKLATHFPGANRGPPAGAGDGAGGDAGAGAAASRPRGAARPAHPARLGASPTRRPTPFTSPGELVASTRGVEHEGDVIQSRTKPVGAVREAGSGSSGGVGGNASEMTIERRRFGGVERRTVQVRGQVRGRGVGGHGSGDASGTGGHANRNSAVGHGHGNNKHNEDGGGDNDDDENYTTVRVKGATFAAKTPPSPDSPASPTSDVAHPAHGRRRSCTPTMERPALAAELDRQRLASNPTPGHERRRRASTPTRVERTGGQRQISPMKDRLNRKTAGLGKAIRGGANKLFASSGGASSGSTSSGTPLSSSGSAGGRRGLGSLDSSNSGTRTRLGGRFFSNAKGVAGGVEDFSSPSHVLARPTPSRTRGARKGGSGEVP